MNLTILLLTVGLLQASANTTGQTVTMSGKDLKLENVFSIVKKQTGFVVFATMEVFEANKTCYSKCERNAYCRFYGFSIKGPGLNYEISNQTILISKKENYSGGFDVEGIFSRNSACYRYRPRTGWAAACWSKRSS